MRVTIRHEEVLHGFLRSKTLYGVRISIVFNEEETEIINTRNLRGIVVLERAPSLHVKVYEKDDPQKFFLRIGHLVRGDDLYCCPDLVTAKVYESDLREALPDLKAYIMPSVDARGGGSETFEL